MGLKPQVQVVANGVVVPQINSRISALVIVDKAGLESDTLTITLTDHDPLKPIDIPPAGAELEVWLGYDGDLNQMGVYYVDRVDLAGPPDSMRISAKAAPQNRGSSQKLLMQTQKTRSWPSPQTLGGLVQTIAAEHGLKPAIAAPLASIGLSHLDQRNESDINLLTRVAKLYDAIAKPAGGNLVVAPKGAATAVSGQPLPAVELTKKDVTRYGLALPKRAAWQSVVATYRDVAQAKDIEVTAGDGQPIKRLRHRYKSAEEAWKAASGELAKAARSEAQLSLSLPGRSDIFAETPLELTGFRDGYNGAWVVSSVTHELTSAGYSCSLSAELPA